MGSQDRMRNEKILCGHKHADARKLPYRVG